MLLFIFNGVVDVITAVAVAVAVVVVVVDYLSGSDKNPIFSADSALQKMREATAVCLQQQQN